MAETDSRNRQEDKGALPPPPPPPTRRRPTAPLRGERKGRPPPPASAGLQGRPVEEQPSAGGERVVREGEGPGGASYLPGGTQPGAAPVTGVASLCRCRSFPRRRRHFAASASFNCQAPPFTWARLGQASSPPLPTQKELHPPPPIGPDSALLAQKRSENPELAAAFAIRRPAHRREGEGEKPHSPQFAPMKRRARLERRAGGIVLLSVAGRRIMSCEETEGRGAAVLLYAVGVGQNM
ncbi:uncharacterized protein LOC128402332 [Podarcis raffonei]|uniref:uncharacterized protein LOC128402332 n=1 Tax=Podarcis raffonei TaxID=65483 RepID=UPI0023291C49|nr:uncharacterized protein LOC128402332 [Podarcis raffonei]